MRQLAAWAGNNLRVLIIVCFALSTITFTLAWFGARAPAEAGGEPQLLEPIGDPTNTDCVYQWGGERAGCV